MTRLIALDLFMLKQNITISYLSEIIDIFNGIQNSYFSFLFPHLEDVTYVSTYLSLVSLQMAKCRNILHLVINFII